MAFYKVRKDLGSSRAGSSCREMRISTGARRGVRNRRSRSYRCMWGGRSFYNSSGGSSRRCFRVGIRRGGFCRAVRSGRRGYGRLGRVFVFSRIGRAIVGRSSRRFRGGSYNIRLGFGSFRVRIAICGSSRVGTGFRF